jgi:hypothetical protein
MKNYQPIVIVIILFYLISSLTLFLFLIYILSAKIGFNPARVGQVSRVLNSKSLDPFLSAGRPGILG